MLNQHPVFNELRQRPKELYGVFLRPRGISGPLRNFSPRGIVGGEKFQSLRDMSYLNKSRVSPPIWDFY